MKDELKTLMEEEMEKVRSEDAAASASEPTPTPAPDPEPARDLPIVPTTSAEVIEAQRRKDLGAILQNDEFQKASAKVNAEDVAAKLDEKDIQVQGQKQKNELDRYKLKLQKRALREKVKADVQAIKIQNAHQRWDYLYKPKQTTVTDENGEKKVVTVYENFTPNKFINRYKELVLWYNSLNDTTQKLIWGTVKFVVRVGIIAAVGFAIYGGIKWLLNSGFLDAIIGAAA